MNKWRHELTPNKTIMFCLTLWFMMNTRNTREKKRFWFHGWTEKEETNCLFVWMVRFGKLLENSGHMLCLGQGLLRCRAQWRMDLVGEIENNFSCLHIIETYPSFLSSFQYSVKEMVGIFHKVLDRKWFLCYY